MEEVDNIIIHTLRQIGCDLPDEIVSLREFTTNMVVEAASKCLHHINEDINLPTSLPASMSARFRIGASLASACQDIGYSGEIGYQTFLYSNEHELRRVYMFLLEKLPKESAETADEPLGSAVLLNRKIANELKRQLSLSWTPPYCKRRNVVNSRGINNPWHFEGNSSFHCINTCLIKVADYPNTKSKLPEDIKLYYDKHLPFISQQPCHFKDMSTSVLEHNASLSAIATEWENEWNSSGLASRLSQEEYKKQKREKLLQRIKKEFRACTQRVDSSSLSKTDLSDLLGGSAASSRRQQKGSRFTHAEQLLFSKDDEEAARVALSAENLENAASSEEEKQKQREDEINNLRDTLAALSQKLEDVRVNSKRGEEECTEIMEKDVGLQHSVKEQEDLYRVKKKTIDLLPNATENISKLEQLVQSSSQRLVNLAAQWEKHRAPLVDQLRELKALNEIKESEFEEKISLIKSVREKMKEAADEVRVKEELQKQLAAEYERMGKDTNRSVYTRRILEIVGNIKKQKEDIDKVLLDTRTLQKDINLLSGKLDRTFTVTDELIFKDAKKDEFNRKAYKLLANLHENFGVLVKTVEDTGSIMREIRDLEDQIDNIRENEDHENYQQIMKDLKQMKQENASLANKLKGSK